MLVSVILSDVDPKMVGAWRQTFGENPEVHIVEAPLAQQQVSAWIVDTLDDSMARALGKDVAAQLKDELEGLSAGDALCIATRMSIPGFVIATSAETEEQLIAPARVCMALAAGLQAVHFQNASSPGAIVSVALSRVGENLVSPEVLADLTWTAYDLFRGAQLPGFASVHQAVLELFSGVDPSEPHAYKKSFRAAMQAFDDEATLPDSAAAQAQLKRRLAQTGKKNPADDGGQVER